MGDVVGAESVAPLETAEGHVPGEYGFSDETPRPTPPGPTPLLATAASVSYLDMLRGKTDAHAVEALNALEPGSVVIGSVPRHDDESTVFDLEDEPTTPPPPKAPYKATRRAPRYFLITDRPAKAIVLCVRGTWSLDDLATDLACEEASFAEHAANWAPQPEASTYSVHGGACALVCRPDAPGMLEIAEAMGGVRGPVTKAVAKAMRANEDYGSPPLLEPRSPARILRDRSLARRRRRCSPGHAVGRPRHSAHDEHVRPSAGSSHPRLHLRTALRRLGRPRQARPQARPLVRARRRRRPPLLPRPRPRSAQRRRVDLRLGRRGLEDLQPGQGVPRGVVGQRERGEARGGELGACVSLRHAS